MEFPSGGQVILDWLGKLEAWCEAQPVGSAHLGLHAEFAWLRAAVRHQLPGTYAPGKQVEDMLRTMRGLPHSRPGTYAPGHEFNGFPQDIVAQIVRRSRYPGHSP